MRTNKIVISLFSDLVRGKTETEEKFNMRKANAVSTVTLFGESVGNTVRKFVGQLDNPLYKIESVTEVNA